jgi:molecular chaperone GrpE (heat shock protein)
VTAPSPGQAAYAAYLDTVTDVLLPPWDELTSAEHRAWEAAAQAADRETTAHYEEVISGLRAETRDLRDRLDKLAAKLELSAARTEPSRKSDIERQTARRVRDVAAGMEGQ